MSTRFEHSHYLTPARAALAYAAVVLPDPCRANAEILRAGAPHGDVETYAAELEAYAYLEETFDGTEPAETPEVDGLVMPEAEWRRYCRAALVERLLAIRFEIKESPRLVAQRAGEKNPSRCL